MAKEKNIMEVIKEKHPWLEYAGIFADDPDWQVFQESIRQYRKEIDADEIEK